MPHVETECLSFMQGIGWTLHHWRCRNDEYSVGCFKKGLQQCTSFCHHSGTYKMVQLGDIINIAGWDYIVQMIRYNDKGCMVKLESKDYGTIKDMDVLDYYKALWTNPRNY